MTPVPESNVRQAVPFLRVADMEASHRFYVEGLGFEMRNKWVVDGKLRWCWLSNGGAALMLQEFSREGHDSWVPESKVGVGVAICFLCRDALEIYHLAKAHGLEPSRPFVGNRMWVTTLFDPDGYRIEFESPTDVAEDAVFAE